MFPLPAGYKLFNRRGNLLFSGSIIKKAASGLLAEITSLNQKFEQLRHRSPAAERIFKRTGGMQPYIQPHQIPKRKRPHGHSE